MNFIVKGNLNCAMNLLAIAADKYMPSALLLAHFLRNSPENRNEERSKVLWESVEETIPSETWGQRGKKEEERKCYSEAIAWLLAYGEKYNSPEFLYDASKNWVKKGCKEQTIAVLKIAAAMGYKKASYFLPEIQKVSIEEFFKKTCTDETLL